MSQKEEKGDNLLAKPGEKAVRSRELLPGFPAHSVCVAALLPPNFHSISMSWLIISV